MGIKLTITSVLFILLSAEMWTVPVALVFPDHEIQSHFGVVNWLRHHGGGETVLELPMSEGFRPVDMELDATAMLRMLIHQNPIVNGYASFYLPAFKQLKRAMVVDPVGLGRRYIDAYGVGYVVVHNHKLSFEQQKNLQQALGDNVVYNDVQHNIYLLSAKEQFQDSKQFLPVTADFQQKKPQRGKTYGLLLSKPRDKTILITPQPDWWIDFSWMVASGQYKTKKIRMRGSVILDINHPRLYFRILGFP